MIELYLHIGSHKTGSTSLQNFLKTNREKLLQKGILYPNFGIEDGVDHHFIIRPLVKKRENDYIWTLPDVDHLTTLESIRDALDYEIEKSNVKKVIISTEFLFVNKAIFNNIGVDVNFAKYVKKLFQGFKIKPIVYLRNQVDWIESCYIEAVKGAHTCYSDSFETYLEDIKKINALDYNTYLKPWLEYFKEDIKVFLYEDMMNNTNSIEKHFLNVFEINNIDSFIKNDNTLNNPSLNKNAIEILTRFNRINKNKTPKMLFPYTLKDLSNYNLIGKAKYLNIIQRKELLNDLKDSNTKLFDLLEEDKSVWYRDEIYYVKENHEIKNTMDIILHFTSDLKVQSLQNTQEIQRLEKVREELYEIAEHRLEDLQRIVKEREELYEIAEHRLNIINKLKKNIVTKWFIKD